MATEVLGMFEKYAKEVSLANLKQNTDMAKMPSRGTSREQAAKTLGVAVEIKRQWQKLNPVGRPTSEIGGKISTNKNRDLAGKTLGVSGRYVDEAEKISKEDPEAFQKIKSGEIGS